MAKETFKRSEKKFMLTALQYERLLEALEGRMIRDKFSQDSRGYTICNLYYDTADSYYIRQSLSKPDYKEKLRLRSYGTPGADDPVYLELKKKHRGIVYKRRTAILPGDAHRLIRGLPLTDESMVSRQVLEEIRGMLRLRPVTPRIFLSYERQALFSAEDDGLRITFDCNILTRRRDLTLESGIYGAPLLQDGLWLMEVKSEHGLPVWFARLLSTLEIYPTGFSKYGAEYQRHVSTQSPKGGLKPCLKPQLTAWLMPLSPSAEQFLAS